jgi:hypothetical protein
VRIRGQIEKTEGDVIDVKARNGHMMKVKLIDPARVLAAERMRLYRKTSSGGDAVRPHPVTRNGSRRAYSHREGATRMVRVTPVHLISFDCFVAQNAPTSRPGSKPMSRGNAISCAA